MRFIMGVEQRGRKSILEQLSYKYRLDLSGTPFRLIEQDDFCSQQVYTYSYLDEQERKKKEAELDPRGRE